MKMYIAAFMVILLLLASCKKHDDFSGDGHFSGLLSYYNPSSGELLSKPLANRKVYLAYAPSDTLNYIYSTTTNSEGYFVFTNADKSKQYDIFFNDTIGAVLYQAIITVSADKDTIQLLATPDNSKQNGIAVAAEDSTGARIKDVSINGYDNYDIYISDSLAGTTAGAVFSTVTNLYGISAEYNIKPGTYYLIAQKEVGALVLTGYKQATVGNFGIYNTSITVKPKAKPFSLKVSTTDAAGNKIEGVTVNAYDNYDIFKADSAANVTTGSVDTITTNTGGYYNWINAPAGAYHFIAKKEAGTLMLAGYKHKQLVANVSDSISIALAPVPVPVPNSLVITVHDTDNNAINEAEVFLYTSNIVAQLDTLRAAYTYSVATTAAGTVTQTNLPSATYFLYGRKIIGTDTLVGSAVTYVPVLGTVNAPIIKIK